MIVMEHALQSHGLVMGSVLRDMLIAMDIATVKLMLTTIIMTAMVNVH